jgi:hypothetical protein
VSNFSYHNLKESEKGQPLNECSKFHVELDGVLSGWLSGCLSFGWSAFLFAPRVAPMNEAASAMGRLPAFHETSKTIPAPPPCGPAKAAPFALLDGRELTIAARQAGRNAMLVLLRDVPQSSEPTGRLDQRATGKAGSGVAYSPAHRFSRAQVRSMHSMSLAAFASSIVSSGPAWDSRRDWIWRSCASICSGIDGVFTFAGWFTGA